MRPGGVGLCAALALVVVVVAATVRGEDEVEVEVVYTEVVCLEVPRLALRWPGLLGSALLVKAACCTRCRRDEVQ